MRRESLVRPHPSCPAGDHGRAFAARRSAALLAAGPPRRGGAGADAPVHRHRRQHLRQGLCPGRRRRHRLAHRAAPGRRHRRHRADPARGPRALRRARPGRLPREAGRRGRQPLALRQRRAAPGTGQRVRAGARQRRARARAQGRRHRPRALRHRQHRAHRGGEGQPVGALRRGRDRRRHQHHHSRQRAAARDGSARGLRRRRRARPRRQPRLPRPALDEPHHRQLGRGEGLRPRPRGSGNQRRRLPGAEPGQPQRVGPGRACEAQGRRQLHLARSGGRRRRHGRLAGCLRPHRQDRDLRDLARPRPPRRQRQSHARQFAVQLLPRPVPRGPARLDGARSVPGDAAAPAPRLRTARSPAARPQPPLHGSRGLPGVARDRAPRGRRRGPRAPGALPAGSVGAGSRGPIQADRGPAPGQ